MVRIIRGGGSEGAGRAVRNGLAEGIALLGYLRYFFCSDINLWINLSSAMGKIMDFNCNCNELID